MLLPKKGEVVPLQQIKEICFNYGLEELWERIQGNPPVVPFSSDGCSAWPDRWRKVNLYRCCFFHDLKYWVGGTWLERLKADFALAVCVARKKRMLAAVLMFCGVRIGGVSWLPTPWRWGFGHKS